MSLRALARYTSLCPNRYAVRSTPSRTTGPGGGKILVRRSEFDRWIAQFRHEGSDLERLVADILQEGRP